MCHRSVTACIVLACAAFGARAELPAEVSAHLAAAGIPEDAVGVVVERLSDGATLLAHGAERSLAPGSTMKVVTSWLALERLGPAYRGRTEMRAVGAIERGVLRGDLVLRGQGDVDLDWQAFERMLQQLRHRGVREIRGDLVLDRSFFSPPRTDVGVEPFDESPEFRYNVVPDALLLNTNLAQVDLVSTSDKLTLALTTPLERVELAADMTLVDRRCEDWEDGWKTPTVQVLRRGVLRIVLHGEFPRGCTASTEINVIDRVTFAERLFHALWSRLGGAHRGRVRDGELSAPGTLVAEHRSRPLADVVRDINKGSDNAIARVTYLTLGALSPEGAGEPTSARAEAEVRGWFERNGVDATGLVLENGSGLSRSERLRPAQLAAVLRAAARGAWSPEFVSSLPIAGIDGTMRRRATSSSPASIRVKTGTLRDTSAIAGYVSTEEGEVRIIAAIVNHPLARREVARPILDELLEWARRQPGRSVRAGP